MLIFLDQALRWSDKTYLNLMCFDSLTQAVVNTDSLVGCQIRKR